MTELYIGVYLLAYNTIKRDTRLSKICFQSVASGQLLVRLGLKSLAD